MTKKKSKKQSSANNIRVVCRARPLLDFEKERGKVTSIVQAVDDSIVQVNASAGKRYFELDAAMCGAEYSHEDIYARSGARNAVTNDIFKGFNCTILAYGQTGSGKTFTMGTASTGDGVIPRACADLFDNIESKCDGNAEVKISYLEIYNDEIRDLQAPKDDPKKLVIRENLNHDIYVSGLESKIVKNPQDVEAAMTEAGSRRVVAATKMNASSSRSHAIAMLFFKGVLEDGTEVESKLTFVDLAGSEKIAKTGAEGMRRAEGININKGLFVLGQVVSALSETRKRHKRKPPYRDSKLTRLLQDSLGGNSHTIMIACVSPASDNAEETLNTLRYATAARNIKNSATQNVVRSISPEEAAKLERENQMLKNQVKELQENMEAMVLEAMDTSVSSLEGGDDSFRISNIAVDLGEKDRRILELEKQVQSQEKKLARAKFNFRKSAHASAIELPALKARVEAMEEELQEMEEVKEENERLYQEVNALKAEASTALIAANRMSMMIESGGGAVAGGVRPAPLLPLNDSILEEEEEEEEDEDEVEAEEQESNSQDKSRQETTDASKEVDDLRNKLTESQAENESLQEKVKKLENDLKESMEELASKEESNASTVQALTESQSDKLQALETELKESKELLSKMNETAEETRQALAESQSESSALKANAETLEAALAQSKQETASVSKEVDDIRGKLTESQAETEGLKENVKHLEHDLKESKEELTSILESNIVTLQDLTDSRDKVQSLTSDVSRLKADLESSGQTIVNLQNELVQQLKQALDESNRKSFESQKETTNLKTIVEGLQEQQQSTPQSDHVPEQIAVQKELTPQASEEEENANDDLSSVSRLSMSLGATSLLPSSDSARNTARSVLAFGLTLGSTMLGGRSARG